MAALLDWEIRLWKRMMLNKYYRIIHNHIMILYHFDELLQKYENHQLEDGEIIDANGKIPRSFLHLIMPSICNAVYIFGAMSFVIWSQHLKRYAFFNTLPAFLPEEAKKYNLTVIAV